MIVWARRRILPESGRGVDYYDHFRWSKFIGDPTCQIDVCLNGGFSLRSKKFMEAPERYGMPYVINPVTGLTGEPYAMHWENGSALEEDVQLTVKNKSLLEQRGIRFPPLSLARNFAFEFLDGDFHNDMNLMHAFGHHATIRKLVSVSPLKLEYKHSEEVVRTIPGESIVIQLFRARGYEIGFAA